MNRDIKISVIVPIFNVETYIRKCIESIINQTYMNIEIILVDDGSTDNSGLICDEYANSDPRIISVHKTNGGLVSARKAGVDKATGNYIINVDGDDWIEESYLAGFVSVLEKNGYDVVWSISFIKDFNNRSELQISSIFSEMNLELIETQEKCLEFVRGENNYQNEIDYSMCFKCVKTELYMLIQMSVDDGISRGEDLMFSLKLLENDPQILFIRNEGYHYVQRNTSMTNNVSSFNMSDYGMLRNHLDKYIKLNNSLSNLAKGYLEITYMNYFFGNQQSDGKEFLYPFNRVKKGSRLIVYGAGNIGKNIVNYLKTTNDYSLVAWIDKNISGKKINDIVIQPISNILKLDYDFIIIATNRTMYVREMKNQLYIMNISSQKIISVFDSD